MARTWHVGTRYHFNDTYATIIKRGAAKLRVHQATTDGTVAGEPVLMSRERLAEKRREMGPYTFSAQMLLDPVADERQSFNLQWMRYYDGKHDGEGLNKYLLVDPASEKKRESDYTAMWCIGLGPDRNYYVLDMIRDRLNLTERADAIFSLHRRWKPRRVGYEKYGMQADIEHFRHRMRQDNYHFELVPLGGQVAKKDRIRGLLPAFEEHRMYFPRTLYKTDYQGRAEDLVEVFVQEEYLAFPVGLHEDMLDALARILDADLAATWPRTLEPKRDRYARRDDARPRGSYMSA